MSGVSQSSLEPCPSPWHTEKTLYILVLPFLVFLLLVVLFGDFWQTLDLCPYLARPVVQNTYVSPLQNYLHSPSHSIVNYKDVLLVPNIDLKYLKSCISTYA